MRPVPLSRYRQARLASAKHGLWATMPHWRRLTKDGAAVWVLGGPNETPLAKKSYRVLTAGCAI